MKNNWFNKAAEYLTKTRTASASPSRTVSESCGHHAQPITYEDPNGQKHTDGYLEAAGDFVRATLARAAVTVSAWTEEPTTLTTNPNETRGSILISAEGILRRGADPAIAADFATGRGLIVASRKEYLLAREEKDMRKSEETYRFYNRSGSKPDMHLFAPGYAAAHIASTIATVRGRETVLKSWAGFAGYFAAAEQPVEDATANTFVNGDAPPIVRAAFALGREVEGHPALTLPPELEPMLEAGRAAMDAQPWKKGGVLDNAASVIDAMRAVEPPHEPEPEDGKGNGSGDEQRPDGDGDPIPGSSMDYMKPDVQHHAWESAKHTPADSKPSASAAAENSSGTRYPVVNIEMTNRREGDSHDMKQLRTDAAPMIAALSRIVWESETPPTVDHAQLRGDLDEGNLLTLAAFNDPRVFQVRQEVGRATVAVHILVDCSGSMFTGTKNGSNRMRDAKAVAYAMAKAFAGSRYKVTVSGHDVQYGTAKVNSNNYVCKTIDDISLLHASGDNADGYAIAHCIDQLAATRADRKALFLLADGQPSATGYGGTPAQHHVRKVVEGAKARGVNFLAIGIENSMAKHGETQFGRHFINLPDTRSAAPLLARVIGKITKEAISSCE